MEGGWVGGREGGREDLTGEEEEFVEEHHSVLNVYQRVGGGLGLSESGGGFGFWISVMVWG